MRNLWLVTRREYVSRLKSGAYIASTAILMLVFFATTFLPSFFESSSKSKPLQVTVLDKTGQVFGPLQEMMKQMDQPEGSTREVSLTRGEGDEAALVERARQGEFALLIVEGQFPGQLKARFLAAHLSALSDSRLVRGPLEAMVRSARMQERGLPPEVALEIMKPLDVEERQLTAGDTERSQEQFMGTLMLAMGAIMSIYMISMINSQFVFQGVLEEKVSRVVEVMAAAVRPTDMMVGKVLGLGALGLTQYFFMMGAWLAGNLFAREFTDMDTEPLSLDIALLIVIFVLLSYVLTATLMAALAATVSRMEDSQTVQSPVLIMMMVPMFLITPVMNDPNGPIAVVLSFIPIFTPIIMLMRVMLGEVAAWQVWLSIGVLVLTTALVAWASGRIYRAALLTFGTRPTMKQLWQYLKAG
ncbi:MAG: ABC transporter permease [Bacillota bacterium]